MHEPVEQGTCERTPRATATHCHALMEQTHSMAAHCAHLHARLDHCAAEDGVGKNDGKDEAQPEEHGGGGGAQSPHTQLRAGRQVAAAVRRRVRQGLCWK